MRKLFVPSLVLVAAAGLVVGVQLGDGSSLSSDVSAQSVADLDVSAVPELG